MPEFCCHMKISSVVSESKHKLNQSASQSLPAWMLIIVAYRGGSCVDKSKKTAVEITSNFIYESLEILVSVRI